MRKAVRIIAILFCCVLTFAAVACGADIMSEKTKNVESNTVSSEKFIDLTVMSGTMVYSQVYDMTRNPSRYVGKTVKVQGTFNAFYSDETGLFYPAVIVQDATACCAQGIEFVLAGDPKYPEFYPAPDALVTVVGEFEIYYENGRTYFHLVNAEISD